MLTMQKKLSNLFYVILGLPATAMGFALSIQIAVLSWILRTKYNLEIDQIGIVWAAGPIAGIIGQPIIGLISDKAWFWGGRRKPFIIMGGILAAAHDLRTSEHRPHQRFLRHRKPDGSGHHRGTYPRPLHQHQLQSYPVDHCRRHARRRPAHQGYTWMQSVSNFFGSLAYLVGALISNYFLIYVGVAIVLLFSIGPMFFITEPRELKKNEEAAGTVAGSSRTQWGQLFRLYFAHGFSWLGIQTMFIYIIAFLEQKIHPDSDAQTGQMIGWSFFILNAVGCIWPAFLLEPMSKKFGRVKMHVLSVATMAAGYFGIVLFARDTWTLYLMMAVLTFGWAAVVSLPFAIMSEKVEKSRMGFFMGIFNLSVVLPQLASSILYRNDNTRCGR